MRILLDTHALLWFALGDSKLSAHALASILDPANEKVVSPVSYWEVALKVSVGKYSLSRPLVDFFRDAIDGNGFQYLHIEPRHADVLASLTYHHRDPFDRMLIAQAIVEAVPLLSCDPAFDRYPITRIW